LANLVIRNGIVVTCDPKNTVYDKGVVVVEGASIRCVGEDCTDIPRDAETIDASGCIVMPGLVNAHTHAAMTLLRGFADDMALKEWLEEKIWPTEMRLAAEDVYWGTMLAAAEMIRAGVTVFNDMYHFFEATTQAIVDSGIRGCPSGVLLGFLPDADERTQRAIDFVAAWKDKHPRVHPMLGPHAPYTCPDALLERIRDAALDLGVGVHIHLSETAKELRDSLQEHGMTPVERLDKFGIFDPHVLAPHCVHVTDSDIALMADRGVCVSHNPSSNMKLASGTAPVLKMLEAGVTVGLGTDGAASNNNLDILHEARLASLLHKLDSGNPTALSALQALRMATIEGAKALGLQKLIGSLEVGKRADIIILDFTRPHLRPLYNVFSHLVYAARASDVRMTIIEGEILFRDGRILSFDEAEAIRKAQECAARITE